MHIQVPVGNTLPRSGFRFEADQSCSGLVFSFLPADGASKAGAVVQQLGRTLTEGFGVVVLLADFDGRGYPLWLQMEAPRRLDGRTWGAFVSEIDGIDILDAREVHPPQLGRVLEHARVNYGIVCADLTGAKNAHAVETLRASDAIFLVAGSDPASLAGVQEKLDWLRSIELDEKCCLLLERSLNRGDVSEVEEVTGLPVCSLVENERQIEQLASWLATNSSSRRSRFALAG